MRIIFTLPVLRAHSGWTETCSPFFVQAQTSFVRHSSDLLLDYVRPFTSQLWTFSVSNKGATDELVHWEPGA